jgi:peroxiredoxin
VSWRGWRASATRSFLVASARETVRIELEEATVIEAGRKAPGFSLKDQFQREISLSQFKGRRHVLLLFYPLDYTPT